MVIYEMIPKVNIIIPENHLIILHEFLMGNKAHTTSSPIQAEVNYLKVLVNSSQSSVKLHLSRTVSNLCDKAMTTTVNMYIHVYIH